MTLRSEKKMWDSLAEFDAAWAILTTEEKKGGKWDLREFFETGRSEIHTLLANLTNLGIAVGKQSVLDFGCGIGRLTQAFAQHFDRCVGVDISSHMIAKARELNRFPENCEYLVNEFSTLKQFHDTTFDLVYSNIVLQHVAPAFAESYIREFVRIVKPHGIVVFQMPYFMHWKRRIQWRRRLFELALLFGINGVFLLKKFGLNPMRMTSLPQRKVESILESSGAAVVHKKCWSDSEIGSCRYVAVKN